MTSASPVKAFSKGTSVSGWQLAMLGSLVIFYCCAGLLHLYAPEPFLLITPQWVPFPRQVVEATGGCEIAGAIGLLFPRLRRISGIMLALYAVCVFPANIMHAIQDIAVPGLPQSWWYHGPRLAFQPVLVWAALFSGGAIHWPYEASPRRGSGSLQK